MKQTIGIFAAIFMMPALSLQAWIGGPFGQNSYFAGGDDGVYEAMATTTNANGLYRWAVRNNGVSAGGNFGGGGGTTAISSNVQFNGGLIGAYSQNVWYYKGVAYTGTCFGSVNTPMRTVSVVGNATNSMGGEVPNPQLGQVIVPAVNGSIIAGLSGNNVQFLNSSFVARIQNLYDPVIRFSGSGTLSVNGAPTGVLDTTTITTTAPTPAPGLTGVGRVRVITSSGGESRSFSQRGERKHFLVFGTKVSNVVQP